MSFANGDQPRSLRTSSLREKFLYLLCALVGFSIAHKVTEAIYISVFYGRHAYFTEGLRVAVMGGGRGSTTGVVLSNGEHLSKGDTSAYNSMFFFIWVMLSFAFIWLARHVFLKQPAQPEVPAKGQIAFYRYRAFDYSGKTEEGFVEATSEELARSLVQRAQLIPCEVWLASVEEIKSQKLKSISAESLDSAGDFSQAQPSIRHPGAPDNCVFPTPSGKCKTRLQGAYVEGTLSLAKRGERSCVLFTYTERGLEQTLEIPFDQITQIVIKRLMRFPLVKLRIATKGQEDFVFKGGVLNVGSVLRDALSTQRTAGTS